MLCSLLGSYIEHSTYGDDVSHEGIIASPSYSGLPASDTDDVFQFTALHKFKYTEDVIMSFVVRHISENTTVIVYDNLSPKEYT